jgi:hypothetical protein
MSDDAVEASVARIDAIMAERRRLLEAGDRSVRYIDHVLNTEHAALKAGLAREFG